MCSDRDVRLAVLRKLPGSAVVGNASEDRSLMGAGRILAFFLAGSPEFPSRMVLETGWCGEELGLGQMSPLTRSSWGNLHNLPGFQEPVGKEVAVTTGREASHREALAQVSVHVDRPSCTGLQRGETRGPQALSTVLWVIFLEESVAPKF